MRWLKTMGVLAIAASIGGLTACGSGNGDPAGGQDPQVNAPEALGSASLSRLPVSPPSGGTVVKGTVSIRDFTVLDNGSGAPSPSGPATGIFVRIIDPGDDILVAGNPLQNGTYELFVPKGSLLARLELEMRVEEDLDGDGEGGDSFRQTVPLYLAADRIHTVSLNISRSTALNLDPNLKPEFGEAVIASIDKLDAGGHVLTSIARFQSTDNVIADNDRDNFIEPGDDLAYEDSNQDGTGDPLEVPTNAGEGPAAIQSILGTVVSVDQSRGFISIRTNDNTIVNVGVGYFTPVENFVFSADGGEFFTVGFTELSQRKVQVTGFFEGPLFQALSVNTF